MAFDDLVNKAKDLLGQGEEKAQDAASEAAAGNTEAAAADSKESASLIDKAKELLTDERIDQAAEAIKAKTPDNVDSIVDQVAAKGKEFNN
jgi:CMP-N-acetylneuraminic acid synthetase